ncbi:phosphate ABC transporter substrate-binding protein [Methanoplanus sp. FWC-SCC4]|uniref:Phosphate ABC transporter substrate-binding protein n=1 Tax=Methanochimaera problematica TaxID=2609417 RepID=A0AA97FB13_9EURY|nr:phosphate ABC transporter substrate-binding protein [Methanoplanus sp. FWC-SCC4]WOF16105.1 phosphate ABC transporter substrate-binding protein [Methanoplanus sp. FWC-SCC4]
MKVSKKNALFLLSFVAVVIMAVLVSGCTGDDKSGADNGKIETLTITGSTTVLPIGQAVAEKFMDQYSNTDLQVSGGGSSVGIQSAGEGTVDIGMASRDLKSSETEKYPELIQHVVALDGIAVIVHKENLVDDITSENLVKVYKGEISNWKELGGDDMEIVVVGRDSSSGTREFFYEKVMEKQDFVKTQLEKNSNGAVKQTVSQTPGAIGYVSMGYLGEDVNGLGILENGEVILPNIENVVDGKYPIARTLNMITRGEPEGLAKEYLEFLKSPEGQSVVEKEGYIPIA